MITFIAHLKVRPENAPAFEALMEEVAAKVRENEPGVPYYAWSKSVDEADTYVVVEVYRDTQVHAEHMASPWVRDSLPISAGLIDGPPHIRQYVTPGAEPVRQRILPPG